MRLLNAVDYWDPTWEPKVKRKCRCCACNGNQRRESSGRLSVIGSRCGGLSYCLRPRPTRWILKKPGFFLWWTTNQLIVVNFAQNFFESFSADKIAAKNSPKFKNPKFPLIWVIFLLEKKYVLNANVSEEKAGRENRVPPRYQRPTSDRIAGPIGRPGGNDSHFFSLQEREFPIFFFWGHISCDDCQVSHTENK